jgi:hypothetical protein
MEPENHPLLNSAQQKIFYFLLPTSELIPFESERHSEDVLIDFHKKKMGHPQFEPTEFAQSFGKEKKSFFFIAPGDTDDC